MSAADVKRPGRAATQPGRESGSPDEQTEVKSTIAVRRFVVITDDDRYRIWGHYATEAEALAACVALRRYGLLARIERNAP